MADVLHSHRLMKPPLFEPFLPFMNGVLSSTLQNQSSCQEKIAQLQHIQFLIEQQVPERRQLIIKLTNHLISVSQRPQTAARISGLVGDENKPHALELSMLLMYLHRYHEWLFRSYKVPLGWPKTIDDLGFTSVNMVDNVSYVAEAVQEPMDICDSSGTPELSNNGGPSCSDEPATHSHDDQGLNIWNSASFQGIVKQFKSVTKASQDVAMNLLKACKGNLEMAINLHYNREEIMPELANAVNDVAMETSPRDLASSDAPSEKEGINQSILSLLVKLKTSMTSSCSSSPERSTACSDGLRYLSELLDTISYSSPENADTLCKLQPGPTQTSSSPSSPEGDSDDLAVKALRRKLARERQQKLLAEFASKQKTFMEKNMPKDAGIVLRMIAHVSNNLGHFNGKRIATTSISSMEACDAGTEGGVHVQTCGHLLHVDCHQSYLKSLQGEDANQLHHQVLSFNPRNGEFTCPLCRQLGNCVVPIVPSHIIPTNTAPKNEAKSHEDRTSDLHASLKKFKLHTITKLTASAWNFTVLGAAIKVVVETVSELAGESERCSADKKFSLLYRMARTNLELEQVDKAARNLSSSRKSCFGRYTLIDFSNVLAR
ncbi:PREDICTED: E3 ubiquitin-protein ligase UBR3-like [Acropora digitifera]|uniref:E3 ubiquitin-protein ligase UBR3-like n=1 Tax=Acropora digitifera TaxID=70779 RepID=UPI00077B1C27|nr:PREDICTED: E3 ubiquitin-protein ligase UBR3-like [Acropora digitifera]